jgi:hypothetical protein
MPGRRGTEKRKLVRMVNVRLSAELATALSAAARRENISDASFARAILAEALTWDELDALRVPRAAPPYCPPPGIAMDLRAAREAAGESCGAAIQLAGLARIDGMAAHHHALEQIIPELRRSAMELLGLADVITRDYRRHQHEALS